jgi:hypothetical protein
VLGDSFTREEISIVDLVIGEVCNEHTAKSISKISHDAIWEMAEIGEDLPFYTVLAEQGEITEEDVAWADTKIAELQKAA